MFGEDGNMIESGQEGQGALHQETLGRRDFLKAALAAGAVGIAGGLAACAPTSTPTAGGDVVPGGSAAGAEGSLAKWSWEIVPEPIADGDIAETIDADVVVVGAGIAGLNAASAAARAGAKTVVLEKSNTFTVHGMGCGAIGSKYQERLGIDIDRTEVLKLMTQWSHNKINQDLFKVWLYRSGEVFDEVIDLVEGAGYTIDIDTGVRGGLDKLEPYYRQYKTSHGFASTPPVTDAGGNVVSPQGVFLGLVEQDAKDSGAEFRYETPAKQLLTDASGGVTGVIAQTSEGAYIKVNASKGVILATGDISGSEEMQRAFSPMPLHGAISFYTPPGANTGDGIAMGLQIGAVTQIAPAAPMVHGFGFSTPFGAHLIGWLQVNRDGLRFNAEEPNEVSNANAMMMQPGGLAWYLFDNEYAEKVLKMEPDNIGFIAGNMIDENTAAMVDGGVTSDPPSIFKADTIEELAGKLGVPADALKTTVARYNELCANGVDEDFGKDPKWLLGSSLDTPPYYASALMGAQFVTCFGLHVNAYSQVLNKEDNPIPHLFAIGNVQGDFFTDDYPLNLPGISHGRCIVYGRLVGAALAKGETYTLPVPK